MSAIYSSLRAMAWQPIGASEIRGLKSAPFRPSLDVHSDLTCTVVVGSSVRQGNQPLFALRVNQRRFG